MEEVLCHNSNHDDGIILENLCYIIHYLPVGEAGILIEVFMKKVFLFLYVILGSMSLWALDTNEFSYSHEINISLGMHIKPFANTFEDKQADRFGRNWAALFIPVNTCREWENMLPLGAYQGRLKYGNEILLCFEVPVERDLESWFQDDLGGNWILGVRDVNINVPYSGWIKWENKIGTVQLGRFNKDIGVSPERSLILSGSPWDDALWAELDFGIGYYTFYAASLEPVLTGTPDRYSDELWPKYSEEWQQHYLSISNAHKRIYADPVKTQFMHGVTISGKTVSWSIYEQVIIGGKYPTLKEASPFTVWHDNFGDGFTNMILFNELVYKNETAGMFYNQLAFDEVKNPVNSAGHPTQWAMQTGWRKVFTGNGFDVSIQAENIFVSPFYGHFDIPLGRAFSRKRFRSNYRNSAEQNFVDTYYCDYPLGYWRGMNLLDTWINIGIVDQKGTWYCDSQFGYLRQGNVDFSTPYVLANKIPGGLPEGTVEEEFRIDMHAAFHLNKFLMYRVVLQHRSIKNENNVLGAYSEYWGIGTLLTATFHE